ncbi:hypothetical protein [Leptolyngbya sp. FACHB-261]|nr:hypothetical protein [Leptolyngbya sp. FACHB-261]
MSSWEGIENIGNVQLTQRLVKGLSRSEQVSIALACIQVDVNALEL